MSGVAGPPARTGGLQQSTAVVIKPVSCAQRTEVLRTVTNRSLTSDILLFFLLFFFQFFAHKTDNTYTSSPQQLLYAYQLTPGWSRPPRQREASQDSAMGPRACIGYLYANPLEVRDDTKDGRDVLKETDLLMTDEASSARRLRLS